MEVMMKIKDLIPWARKDEEQEESRGEDHPIAALQREMNEVFETFRNRLSKSLGELDWPWGPSEAKSDMVKTDDAVEITIELPGMEMKDIEVTISDDMLTVKGEKKVERQEEKKGYYLSERSYGAIRRTIPLPSGVDAEKADASLKNGVLTIRLPRLPEAKTKARRIEVKAS